MKEEKYKDIYIYYKYINLVLHNILSQTYYLSNSMIRIKIIETLELIIVNDQCADICI